MSKYAEVGSAMGYGDGKLCARVDIQKASQVDDVSIDDTVTIVVKGKVKSLRGGEQYKSREYLGNGKEGKEVTRTHPGSIELEITSVEVHGKGAFDGMLED